jgi:HD-GYP domain-containing protein (c-di-GMP phosphodiesterase class II)
MAQRKILLTDLKVGMFLIGVDRSWLHTPFLRHKFKITDQSEIETLRRAGIGEVTIDPEQGLDVESATSESVQAVELHSGSEANENRTESARSGPGSELPSSILLAENFGKAKQRRAEWMNRLNTLFEGTRLTGLVRFEVVHQLVDEMIGEILDQQAACFAVLGLRQPDPTLHEHGLTVCTLSVILGQALTQPPEVLHHVGVGALLHDIGLARLPRNIIKRPKTMPAAQQALYLTHPALGASIIEKSGSTDPAVMAIVKGHHDVVSPTDVPGPAPISASGLAGLVGIVDQYDELVTGQTGLPPMSSNQALTQLYQRYQSHPALLRMVSYLIRAIGVYPLYSVVALNSGELGVVGAITPGKAHLPLLYLCRDPEGRSCIPPVPLDLVNEPDGGKSIYDVRDAAREGVDIEAVLRQVAA